MSKLLHICFLSQEYPPETGWGGMGSYTYDMAHALIAAGHRVTVIAMAARDERITDDEGVRVHRIRPSPSWGRMRVLWRLGRIWPGFAWAAMCRLRSIHSGYPVDIVEAGECRADGFFVSWLPRPRPRIVTRLHLGWIFVDKNNGVKPALKRRIHYWLEKQSILRADAVTAPSAAAVELTRTWLGPNLPVRVVPNPIDVRGFSPNGDVRERELLFVGRLERGKGLATLCQVIPLVLDRYSDARIRILGADGADEKGLSWRLRILASVRREDHRRICFNRVARGDLAESYRKARVCVVPSLWENCPYVVLEAMACGTPVVASRTGGIPELVQDGRTGFLVAPEAAQEFAGAICQLLDDPEKARRMGTAARRRAESIYSSSAVVRQMLSIYDGSMPGEA